MAKRQAADVGPINPDTGKPFYTPLEWEDVQRSMGHKAAVARQAVENAPANRGKETAANAAGQRQQAAHQAQPKPVTPAGALHEPDQAGTLERMMPAQKPIREVLGAAAQQLQQATLVANNNRAYTLATPAQRKEKDLTWMTPPASPTSGPSPTQRQVEAVQAAAKTPTTFTPPASQAPRTVQSGANKPAGASSASGTPAPTGPTSPAGTAGSATGFTPDQISAAVAQMEATYGVPASIGAQMAPWYLEQQANNQTTDEMQNSMYSQSWFKQAFPGLAALMANGQSPPSNVATPLQYAQDYASVQEMTASYGAPSAVSPALYGELVAKGMTSADIKNNLSAVFSGSAQTNKEAQAMLSQWYGVPNTPGAIATLMIDPNGALARANAGAGVMPSQQLAGQVGQAAQGGAMAGQSGFNKLSKSDLLAMASTATGSQIGAAASADVGALGATETGTTNAPTVTEAQLLESGGSSNAGIQANKGAQVAVERAVGARTAQFGGGGGNAGAGQPGESGAGFGTQ